MPSGDGMLSISTVSVAGSITSVSGSTNRDTRFTGVVGVLRSQTPNFLNV